MTRYTKRVNNLTARQYNKLSFFSVCVCGRGVVGFFFGGEGVRVCVCGGGGGGGGVYHDRIKWTMHVIYRVGLLHDLRVTRTNSDQAHVNFLKM